MLRIRDAIATRADTAALALRAGLAARLDALRWIRSGPRSISWFLNGNILPCASSRAGEDGQVGTVSSAVDSGLHQPSNWARHSGQISAATRTRARSTKNTGARYRSAAGIPEAILQLTGTETRRGTLRLGPHWSSVPRMRQSALERRGSAIWQANRRLHTLAANILRPTLWPYFKVLITEMGYQTFTWPLGSGILLRIKLEKPSL